MHLFSMYGRVVRVIRYTVRLAEGKDDSSEAGRPEPVVYCYTQEEASALAQRTGGRITALDSSAYEWMDGIEVADVPSPYGEAVRIYEMGREAYEAERNRLTPEEQVTSLEAQLTETQLALCEMYEAIVGKGVI